MSDLSWCRHCVMPDRLTDEHLPARSAGNDRPIGEVAWPGDDAIAESLRHWPEGFALRTLCPSCNENGSRWGFVKEYRRWRALGIDALEGHCAKERRPRPAKLVPGEGIDVELTYDRMPGRFARYVIGMFLAAQRSPNLIIHYPRLTDAVRCAEDRSPPSPCDIAPTRLFLAMANMPVTLTCDTVTMAAFRTADRLPSGLSLPLTTDSSVLLQMAIYSPFAFVLVLDGNPPAGAGIEITHWLKFTHHQRLARAERHLTVPVLALPMIKP